MEELPYTANNEDELEGVVIYPAGLMPFVYLSPEKIRRWQKAQQDYESRKHDKNNKPPKPPSRPNAGVHLGNVALGHG